MIYVLHDLMHLDLDPGAADMDVVISGHTHQPCIETKAGVLVPESGQRRTPPVRLSHLGCAPRGRGRRPVSPDPQAHALAADSGAIPQTPGA